MKEPYLGAKSVWNSLRYSWSWRLSSESSTLPYSCMNKTLNDSSFEKGIIIFLDSLPEHIASRTRLYIRLQVELIRQQITL
ncbi:unnamed protein product [Heterobilharzia americana]|nr:unnamed protein product [Heterobilharzia americana]CAH8608493.1 unnamed protein product [Heterobilharzia americana]